MTRYLVGAFLTVLAVVPMQLGIAALRRAVLPGWQGPPAWLADAVAGSITFVVAAQLAGAFGVFSAVSVAALTAVGGALCGLVLAPRFDRGAEAAAPPAAAPSVLGRWTPWVAAGIVALTAAPWIARTARAARFGVASIDSLWYHLPAAARFAEEGRVFDLQTFDAGPTTIFYPQDTALFHAFGMSAFGSDVLSPFINLGWLALALLAGWCIGRPAGVSVITMAGTAVLLSTPVFVGTQPGGAYNDVALVAFLLCAVALVVNTDVGRRFPTTPALALAGGAIGIVLGAKWTGLAGVGMLTLGVVAIAPAGRRIRSAVVWVVGAAVTGGAWYLRNLVEVHNPLPPIGGSLGPISVPEFTDPTDSASVAHFLFDGTARRRNFLPGFALGYGVLWEVVLGCVAAGLVLAMLRGPDRRYRMLGGVGAVALVAYVVQPQFITSFGRPIYFFTNLRYPAIGLVLGLVLLPVAVPRRTALVVLGLYVAVLVVLQTDPTTWPTGLRTRSFAFPIERYAVVAGVVGGLVVLAIGLVLASGRLPRRALLAGVAGFALVALVGGYAVQSYNVDHRYRVATPYESAGPARAFYRWASTVHDRRIAVVGDYFQYPFTGDDQSNHVDFLTTHDRRGAPATITRCRVWRRAVTAGDYDYVVTANGALRDPDLPAPEAVWTAPGPASRVVDEVPGGVLFRITGPLDPDDCPKGKR